MESSEESDYEDESYGVPSAACAFSMEKEGSDSQDSCNSEHNFQNFNEQDQNSNDEDSNQDVQCNKMYTGETTYNAEAADYPDKTEFHDSSGDTENETVTWNMHAEYQETTTSNKRKKTHDTSQSKRAKRNDDTIPDLHDGVSKKKVRSENAITGTTDGGNRSTSAHTSGETKVFDGADKAMRMMKNMGYEHGRGLGKNKEGRLEPLQAHKQRGYSGLGFRNHGLEKASLQWDPKEEVVKAVEDIDWLKNTWDNALTEDQMHDWIKSGPRKKTINDETNFCDPDIVADIINSKTVFDTLDKNAMRNARTRSNPYETIRAAFFLNRAAVKMANIDRACDFMFTSPSNMEPDELLYFADVCAGPGGFSEYVLWRKKWHAKGFGFTLKNENDFKLSDFYAGPCETFYPYYGPKGDGDVFDPINQQGFKDLIINYTDGKGVHFMMSDGGFSVEGQENIQEVLSKQLYLCQCIVALMIVRTKGHFVTKLFDLFTPFSAGLIYLMYRCFDEISIFKPNSSRPANSERYLICKGKRPRTEDVLQHLLHINDLLISRDDHTDVLEIVPLQLLKSEEAFAHYLTSSNELLGKKQITGLLKIAAYCEDSTLMEFRQGEMRKHCLEYWKIPTDKTRTVPKHCAPMEKSQMLLKNNITLLSHEPTKLTESNINETILLHPRNWFFMPCGSRTYPDQTFKFYLGMGRRLTYRFEKSNWILERELNFELPRDTLVYAETVNEFTGESRSQPKVPAIHILDAYMLGGEDISMKYIEDRLRLIRKFCKALWKPTDAIRVRAKDIYPLDLKIRDYLKVTPHIMKNGLRALGYDLPKTPMDYSGVHSNATPYFIPKSIVFFKSTAPNWSRHYSKRFSSTYVFNCKTRDTKYDNQRPQEAEANFAESFTSRTIWYWPDDGTLTMNKVLELLERSFKT